MKQANHHTATKDNRPKANSQERLQDNQWNTNGNSHINALLMNLTNLVAGIAKERERLSALINKNTKDIEDMHKEQTRYRQGYNPVYLD